MPIRRRVIWPSRALTLQLVLAICCSGARGADFLTEVSVINAEGRLIDTLWPDTQARIEITIIGLQTLHVEAQLTFLSPAAPPWLVKAAAPACRVYIDTARHGVTLDCPLPRPPLSGALEYKLTTLTYTVQHKTIVTPTTLPLLQLWVPNDFPEESPPLVLQLKEHWTSSLPVNEFDVQPLLANLQGLLPKRSRLRFLGTRPVPNGTREVVLALDTTSTEGPVAATVFLLERLNRDAPLQSELGIVPPAALGRYCPRAEDQVCSGVASCLYAEGLCLCPAAYEGPACQHPAVPPAPLPGAAPGMAIVALVIWLVAWPAWKITWALDKNQRRRKFEQFARLSPLHRTTPGTLPYRILATVYVGLCLAGCALPPTSPWASAPTGAALSQALRCIRLDLPNTPGLPILAFVAVALFLVFSLVLNRRLLFLVRMNVSAWHHSLDCPDTQRLALNQMTWMKPRLRPPGYTPHLLLLGVHLAFGPLAPPLLTLLFSCWACDEADSGWVSRIDHQVACFKGPHIAYATIAALALLVYYGCFLACAYVFVAATERLQHRNLELGLPSLIRDTRTGFVVQFQAVAFIIGSDVLLSQTGPLPTLIAGLVLSALGATCLWVYQTFVKPCNIPLCDWVAGASNLFPLWCFLMVIPSFFLNPEGLEIESRVLLGLLFGHTIIAVVVVILLFKAEKGPKGGAPAWFAVRMQQSSRREQNELRRINSARHMSKEELEIDVEGLRTPRSFGPRSPTRRTPSSPLSPAVRFSAPSSPARPEQPLGTETKEAVLSFNPDPVFLSDPAPPHPHGSTQLPDLLSSPRPEQHHSMTAKLLPEHFSHPSTGSDPPTPPLLLQPSHLDSKN